MSPTSIKIRKLAILIHRWMGVFFCVLFAAWFISGITMMYWSYPEVGQEDRLGRSPVLDASRIQISPEQAYASLHFSQPPRQVKINTLDGRPVYRFRSGPTQFLVYADDGKPLELVPQDLALRVASAWTGQPASLAKFNGAIEKEDQWTVNPSIRPFGPFWKYSWPDGQEVYVSQISGEVVQHTTRGSRIAAYFGAIPHWLYFTGLRRNNAAWRAVVIWSSGIGMVMIIFGLVVGLWLYSPSKRYRFRTGGSGTSPAGRRGWRNLISPEGASSIPYAGQKRWHTVLGLFFGLVILTWTFSGMLSMNPLQWSPGGTGVALAAALRGAEWRPEPFASEHPSDALRRVAPLLNVKELELMFFRGGPVYVATEAPGRSRIIPLRGTPELAFDRALVVETVALASRPHALAEVRTIEEYEPYYVDRHHGLPLPALLVRLNDSERYMHYIELRTGRIVESYVTRSRWNRWLYHGLHSFDLPWL